MSRVEVDAGAAETLLIGSSDGLVRASANGSLAGEWVLRDVPVQMVALDPLEPDRMYAATLGQGLLRSSDGGRTFSAVEPIGHDLVWSVAVSASDRAGGFGAVYAGTQMTALFKSGDGGRSWEELTSVQEIETKEQWSFPPAPDTHHVHQIALDVEAPGAVVFGIELGGVYSSRDAGASWELTAADPDPHTLRSHPTDPGRMYQGGGAAYYASRDAGATWERNLDGLPDEVRYFYSVAVDAGDPENVLLSGARDPFSGHAVIPGVPVWSSLYRLVDERWHEVTEGLPPRDGTAMGTLAAGGPGIFYYVTDPGEVFRSGDGGASFAPVGPGAQAAVGNGTRCVLVLPS